VNIAEAVQVNFRFGQHPFYIQPRAINFVIICCISAFDLRAQIGVSQAEGDRPRPELGRGASAAGA
jgi:hypothetical protein